MAELLDKGTLKISPLVRVYPFGHPEPVEPAVHQDLRYSNSTLVLSWHGLGVLRKDISHDQHILSSTCCRFQQSEVNGKYFLVGFSPLAGQPWTAHNAGSFDSAFLFLLPSLASNIFVSLGQWSVTPLGAHVGHEGCLTVLDGGM